MLKFQRRNSNPIVFNIPKWKVVSYVKQTFMCWGRSVWKCWPKSRIVSFTRQIAHAKSARTVLY